MTDTNRNWVTPFQDIAVTFSEAMEIVPALGVDETVAGLTAQVNGGANSALTYRSGNGTASWTVRRAELIQQNDTVVLDYVQADGAIVAVTGGLELSATTDVAVTNNLTKRARIELKDKNNALVVSTTIGYTFTDISGSWSTVATDANGLFDVQYSGVGAVGSSVYLAVRVPNVTPTQAMVWTFEVR